MSKPILDSFFLGRALAETINQKAGEALTYGLSELGKLNAEGAEQLRKFSQEVKERAERETSRYGGNTTVNNPNGNAADLQETIDDLRAEIARLRSDIQQHKSSQS
jgi:polyhydroxyalkanoate synthesis regulator phasin